MDLIFFIYGLSFFMMGVLIVYSIPKESKFIFADKIWILGIFGIIHGLSEWIDLYRFIYPDYLLKLIKIFFMIISYLFLFEFSRYIIQQVLFKSNNKLKIVFKRYIIYPIAFLSIFIIIINDFTPNGISNAGRYVFGFSGSFILGVGLYLYGKKIEFSKEQKYLQRYFKIAGISMIFYAFFGGLIVSPSQFFLANIINTKWFLNIFGLPVQLFRAVCAITIAISSIKILQIFHHEREDNIFKLAFFDQLTTLPNKLLFIDRLTEAIKKFKRYKKPFVMIFINIDNFKFINEEIGYYNGDKILYKVAKRVKTSLREQDTVARFGGDTFALLLVDTDNDDAVVLGNKLVYLFNQPFTLKEEAMKITVSIGMAQYPSDGTNQDQLLKAADIALSEAKKYQGENNFLFFNKIMKKSIEHEIELAQALRYAIKFDELELYFQPQVSLDKRKVTGAESLLRWNSKKFGRVSPAEFIPIAERYGYIFEIGEWVIKRAAMYMKTWIDDGFELDILAINLSAIQFKQYDFVNVVQQIFKKYKIPLSHIEFEITEGVLMQDTNIAVKILNDFHKLDIKISIDDFGTGYSSLAYLKYFNIDKLKIDQSFVCDLTKNKEDKAIIRAIIALSKSLGINVIAEGAEDKEQIEFLYKNGCKEIQGYYFSKPLPATDFKSFVEDFTFPNLHLNEIEL